MNERDIKRLGRDAQERARSAAAAIEAAARDRGLLDVAVSEADSPVGRLLVAVTKRGVARVAFDSEDWDTVLEELAQRISPRVLTSRAGTEQIRRELDEYFNRQRHVFDVPADLRLASGFRADTLRATARIPFGSIRTYGQLAVDIGRPRAARAIGNAVGSNPVPIVVPCHRVLRSGGALGGYGGGVERKVTLLDIEGVSGFGVRPT
jgi:methylated-DNA-[protein]-cysteine S-methyltransferase